MKVFEIRMLRGVLGQEDGENVIMTNSEVLRD
jgi:hypothetical protein